MDLFTIILIGIAMGLDCFSVAICVGASRWDTWDGAVFRMAFHFGLFHTGMLLGGYFAGRTITDLIARLDHWIAFAVLGYTGAMMIIDGLKPGDEQFGICPSRGVNLIGLSLATSVDALAIGLSFALVDQSILVPAISIGVIPMAFTIIGLTLGDKLGARFGKRVEITGGVILTLIGLRIVLEHVGILG